MAAREGGYDAVVFCRNCIPSAGRQLLYRVYPMLMGLYFATINRSLLCKQESIYT